MCCKINDLKSITVYVVYLNNSVRKLMQILFKVTEKYKTQMKLRII